MKTVFPTRQTVMRNTAFGQKFEFHFNTRQSTPSDIKIGVREACKKHHRNHYFLPVELENASVSGLSHGQRIPISNLGRWAFGVSGYKGHYTQELFADKLVIWIPKQAPQPVVEMFQELTSSQIIDCLPRR